jgi:ubiquinone/menaquinone biosynthesis C-methylase UbiE
MRRQDATHIDALVRQEMAATEAAFAAGPANPPAPFELPRYLVKHYAWAYIWPFSVWFFDHQPIINAILFGNYRKIMRNTMRMMETKSAGRTLQVAGVYGELTPSLARDIDDLYLIDAAPIQLEAARRKVALIGRTVHTARMKAEALTYESKSFDTVLVFLLLHEMPTEERHVALREALRVLKPGGRLVMAEYGEFRKRHFFHRFWPMRWILTHAEPFLGSFWKEDLDAVIADIGRGIGRAVECDERVDIFGGFYRVMRYRVT